MQQLMTQAEFARHRGVSPPAVSNWKKAGLLVLQEDETGRIKVNVERTVAKLNAKIDPMRGRPPVGVASVADLPATLPLDNSVAATNALGNRSLNDERVDQVREQRIGNALKNAQLAGELVPVIEAQRRVNEAGRAMRERITAWFRGAAEQLAATHDLRTVMTIGEEGLNGVFAELADAAARGEFADDENDDLTLQEEAEMEAVAAAEE